MSSFSGPACDLLSVSLGVFFRKEKKIAFLSFRVILFF